MNISEYDYVEVEFLEVKEEEEFKEVYFTLKNKSDYYMMANNLSFNFNDYNDGVNEPIELKALKKDYYKDEESTMKFYISPREEEVYFVKIPKDVKFTVGYEGTTYIRYFLEVRLYLMKINENSLYKEIFMMSRGDRIEVDPKLLNN